MKKLHWFTETKISSRNISSFMGENKADISFDLSEFLDVFIENKLWNKRKYRTEYKSDYTKEDLEKIKKININIHNKGPYSNTHDYEKILNKYIKLADYESFRISSSGITEVSKIAVIEVEFESQNKIIDYLTYDEEKDIDTVFEKKLSKENHESWIELNKIKSIVCEFIQFFTFNMHLNFLTTNYTFSFENKPNPIGFITLTKGNDFYYETDKIDFLSHYILYDHDKDRLTEFMRLTSKFWHKNINSIHFFLDALKGSYITATDFIKLVFTVESFFGKNISNDYVTLTIPLILCKNIHNMKAFREVLKEAFNLRNDIVHGNEIFEFKKCEKLFFELKNILTLIFHFYINNELYNKRQIEKINHELIFKYFPKGIS